MLRIYRKSEHPIHEALKHELTHFMKNSENYKQFTEFAEKSEMFAKWLQRYGFNNIQDAQNQIIDSRETRGMEWSISDARKEVYANFVQETLFGSDEKWKIKFIF